jgi:hypothetical protein
LVVSGATLTQVQIAPSVASLPRGVSQQFQAVGVYSDGTHRTVTGVATWVSTDPSAAVVSNVGGRGVVTALAPGSTKIRATVSGVTGEAPVTVTDATVTDVQLIPVNPSVPRGINVAFVAMAIFSDLSTRNVTGLADWTSADPAVAVVSNAPGTRGRATPVAVGSAKISAAYLGKTGSTTLKVTAATVTQVQIVPARITMPAGVRVALSATAVLSDGTSLSVTDVATWIASDPLVASVSNAPGSWGLLTSLKAGTSQVTANVLGVAGMATVTVGTQQLASILVEPATAQVAAGAQRTFIATGVYDDASRYDLTAFATWISSAPAVAAVSNVDGTRGQATGLAPGTANIDATFGGKTGSGKLTVGP